MPSLKLFKGNEQSTILIVGGAGVHSSSNANKVHIVQAEDSPKETLKWRRSDSINQDSSSFVTSRSGDFMQAEIVAGRKNQALGGRTNQITETSSFCLNDDPRGEHSGSD